MPDTSGENGARKVYILGIASVAAVSGLLFGFDTSVISGALDPVTNHFSVQREFVKEFLVASITLGALFGAASSSWFSSRQGRKKSLIFSALVFIGGTLGMSLAPSISALMACRLVLGFAVGLSAMVAPMYLSEVSPPKMRGAVVFSFQLAITLGILGAYCTNYAFAESQNWRWMFGVGLIPSLLLFAGMLKLPESPRWLVSRGRHEEAAAVLRKILPKDVAALELESITSSVSRPQGGLKSLFSKRLFPVVGIAFTLFVLQQLSGINTIFYYAPVVLKEAGFANVVTISLLPATINVLAGVLGMRIVDKLGRRPLAFLGFGGMAVCLLVLGADLSGLFDSVGFTPLVALVSVMIYIFFFAVSIGGIPFIMMSELFPLHIRDVGMAVASCANWSFNFLVSLTFLTLSSLMGMGGAFFLYAVFMVAGVVFTFFFLPETKGKRLEDIEANLYAGNSPRHLGDSMPQA